MKKIKIILCAFIILLACNACDKKLDIKPQQSIKTELALSTSENIKSLLVSAYEGLRDDEIYTLNFNSFSELLATSGDLRFIGTYDQPDDLNRKNLVNSDTWVEQSWIAAYEAINILNTVLNKIDIVVEDEREKIRGEALCLRGWIYFDMVRLWGLPYESGTNSQLGVPLVLEPTLAVEDAINVSRATVEEVYTQVIIDLTAAKTALNSSGNNDIWASTYLTSAILARVYLQQGEFLLAATEANTVIELGGYSLVSSPIEAFNNNENSSEDIFAFQQNDVSSEGWLSTMYGSLNGTGRGDYIVSQSFLDSFDPSDLRGQLQTDTEDTDVASDIDSMYYIGVGNIANYGDICTIKWGDQFANTPIVRLAEMYLIRAEGNFESGAAQVGPNTPTQDINMIRDRANAPQIGTVTRQDIRDERYFELCWEGHRLHDLKRWQTAINYLGETYEYDDPRLILPIPSREISANENLVQNEGY